MGNAFRRFGALGTVVSAALFVCSACSGTPDEEATSEGPPPYQGSLTPLPTAPAASTPAPSDGMQPAGATAPINEGPAANNNTPVAPPVQMAGGATPPQQTPPAMTPPAMTPPAMTPPAMTPPAQNPPTAARTQVFLLFGQSNMFGVPAPQAQDLPATEGAEVLTLTSCAAHQTNQWVPAQPPLHGCVGRPSNGDFGPGLGPGDYFAKTVTAAFPDDTILLVPNAIAGVSIDTFAPGAQAYNSLVSRARMAQQRGEIRGILFHQGEADSGSGDTWVPRVARVVSSLRSDLGLGEGVPFIAGELPPNGCCSGHNRFVNQLPNSIPNALVVSAQGLNSNPEPSGMYAGTRLHFDVASQREFGKRYANVFLQMRSGQ